MKERDKLEVLEAPVPLPERITEKTLAETNRQKFRFRGSVRIATGRIYTDDEYEARRRKILGTPLPHTG